MWMYWLKHRKSEPLEVGPRNLHFTSFPGSAKAGGIEWCKCLCESMATHFSVLAWRIPWTERPGRLQSMESHRVGHNWSDLAVAAAYLVKNPLEMQETRVQSLGWEVPLEKGMATHSSILAWRIPWTEEPGSPWSCKELDATEWLTLPLYTL